MCQSYNFQNVLIGNENIERKADMLPPSLGLFFTPTHRVVMKVSKYSGAKSLMSSAIRTKNFLNVRVSQREINELETQKRKLTEERSQLFNKRNEIESSINLLEEQCKTNFQEKAEHQKRIFEVEQLRNKVKLQEKKLQRLIDEPVDVESEKEKFGQQAKEIIKNMLKCYDSSIKAYDQMMKIELKEVEARARLIVFKNGTANFDAQLMECRDEIDRTKAYCDRIGTILDKTKQEAKEKQLKALKLTNNHRPTEGDNFPFKKDFDELADDRGVLTEEMEDLEQQIRCRSANDQAVIDEYNER